MNVLNTGLLLALPLMIVAQPAEPLDSRSKLGLHVERVSSPLAMAGLGASAGIMQWTGSPEEWGQGARGYGRRFASTAGTSAIRETLAFGLDSTLHQDPRYFRSLSRGFWRRAAHALRGTILTPTDRGGETLSAWRLGSAYGAAFLSNQWYPDRLNTFGRCMTRGSLGIGVDFATNLASEFWPDLKRKALRR